MKNGQALAALIIPGDITSQIESLVTTGVGSPTVQLILNSSNPLEQQFVEQSISSKINQLEQAVSKQVLRVAIGDLQEVLKGGTINIAGQEVKLLGLRVSRSLVQGAITALPRGSAFRPALQQVVNFAGLAIQGLSFASPVLGSIGTPLTVQQSQVNGRTTPADSYAATIAVVISLMLVTLVLAASLLAIERSENTYARLVRGLVSPGALLGEKVGLAAAGAGLLALLMAALVFDLRAPGLGALRALGRGAGRGRGRLRRSGSGHRGGGPGGQRGLSLVPAPVAADRLRGPGPRRRRVRWRQVRAGRGGLRISVPGRPGCRRQRLHGRLTGHGGAADPSGSSWPWCSECWPELATRRLA